MLPLYVHLLLILASTVQVPGGFATCILYKSTYLDCGRIWAVQGNRPWAD